MNATATFDIGTILLSVAGFLFVLLLGIIGFGIRSALGRLEKAIDAILAKLELTMTTARCGEYHNNHQEQHAAQILAHKEQHILENQVHKEQHDRIDRSINGIGAKLQKHIDEAA